MICLNDEFLVNGIECVVRFINLDNYFLFPIEDTQLDNGRTAVACCMYAVMNSKGHIKGQKGLKAHPIHRIKSGAV